MSDRTKITAGATSLALFIGSTYISAPLAAFAFLANIAFLTWLQYR